MAFQIRVVWRSSIFSVEAKTVMWLSTSIVNVIKFLSGFHRRHSSLLSATHARELFDYLR
jgi:hypothetical protein